MLRISVTGLLLVCWLSTSHAGSVKMYTDSTYTKKVKRKKLKCDIHREKKKSLTFGFKLSIPFLLSVGPEIKFGKSSEIKWNDNIQEIIRRYEELCDHHNKGLLTIAEFNARYKDLENFYEKTFKLKQQISELVEKHADKAFQELDSESGRRKAAETVTKDINKFSTEIEGLAKAAKSLKPTKKIPESKQKKSFWKRK